METQSEVWPRYPRYLSQDIENRDAHTVHWNGQVGVLAHAAVKSQLIFASCTTESRAGWESSGRAFVFQFANLAKETCFGKTNWQGRFTRWAGTTPKPAWLPLRRALELSLLCCDTAANVEVTPFLSPVSGSFRWKGVAESASAAMGSKTRLSPSDTLPVLPFGLSSILGSSALLKNPYHWNIFKLLKGTAMEICIGTKDLATQASSTTKDCLFHWGSKGTTPNTLSYMFLICLDESHSYYGWFCCLGTVISALQVPVWFLPKPPMWEGSYDT